MDDNFDEFDDEEYEDFEDGNFIQNTCFTDYDRAGIERQEHDTSWYVNRMGETKPLPIFVSIVQSKFFKKRTDQMVDGKFNVVIPKMSPAKGNLGPIYPSDSLVANTLEKCVYDLLPKEELNKRFQFSYDNDIKNLEEALEKDGMPRDVFHLFANYRECVYSKEIEVKTNVMYGARAISGKDAVFARIDLKDELTLKELASGSVPYLVIPMTYITESDKKFVDCLFICFGARFSFFDEKGAVCEPRLSYYDRSVLMRRKTKLKGEKDFVKRNKKHSVAS